MYILMACLAFVFTLAGFPLSFFYSWLENDNNKRNKSKYFGTNELLNTNFFLLLFYKFEYDLFL